MAFLTVSSMRRRTAWLSSAAAYASRRLHVRMTTYSDTSGSFSRSFVTASSSPGMISVRHSIPPAEECVI